MRTIQQITNINILLYLLPIVIIISAVANQLVCKFIQYNYPVWVDVLFILGSIIISVSFQPYRIPSAMILFWGLFTLSLTDIFYRILPTVVNLILLIFGLQLSLNHQFISINMAILGALIGYLILWLTAVSYKIISGQSGIGGGDLKLAAALGAWIGPGGILNILFWSSLLGCMFYCVMALKGKYHKMSRIPFGVFLSIAGMGNFMLRFSLWHW